MKNHTKHFGNHWKGFNMRLKKKIGKRLLTLVLVTVITIGGNLSVLADTGFTVSAPSLSYFNKGYIVSGGVSYSSSTSSTSYYLMDEVYVTAVVNGVVQEYRDVGYGYGSASAMCTGIPVKPYAMQNIGSYKSGASFTHIQTRTLYP